MNSEDGFEHDDKFPWEDVEAARKNRRLQRKHSANEGERPLVDIAKPCPKCHVAANQLTWFYFESPAETWKHLCGRAGWMSVCDQCHLQVEFFCEVMN